MDVEETPIREVAQHRIVRRHRERVNLHTRRKLARGIHARLYLHPVAALECHRHEHRHRNALCGIPHVDEPVVQSRTAYDLGELFPLVPVEHPRAARAEVPHQLEGQRRQGEGEEGCDGCQARHKRSPKSRCHPFAEPSEFDAGNHGEHEGRLQQEPLVVLQDPGRLSGQPGHQENILARAAQQPNDPESRW